MLKTRSVLILSIISISLLSTIAKADTVIVASKSAAIQQLSQQQAKKLWLGKSHKLPGVGRVTVLDRSRGDIKEEFYRKLTKKNPKQLRAYWAKIIFTGKATPPKSLSSDQKIIDLVKNNPKILGYISRDSVTDDVKILMSIQ